MNDIFWMGEYGTYVWTAYSITLFVFGLNIFMTYREKHKIKKLLKTLRDEST